MPRIRSALHGGTTSPRTALTAILACGLLLAVGCAGTGMPAEDRPAFEDGYRVGPPDTLLISVLPDPVIERTVVVRPDGMISVDLVGDVPAAGRAVDEIAADIEQKIAQYKRGASVTVAVQQASSPTITVLGEVRSPATFPLARETRVAEALGMVRGATNYAATSRIRVIRYAGEGAQVYTIDLNAIQRGDYRTNIRLQAGDLVYVPRTVSASIGFALQGFFFPFQQVFGMGTNVATTVFLP